MSIEGKSTNAKPHKLGLKKGYSKDEELSRYLATHSDLSTFMVFSLKLMTVVKSLLSWN
jgi:hypothetical protein